MQRDETTTSEAEKVAKQVMERVMELAEFHSKARMQKAMEEGTRLIADAINRRG